MCATSRLETSDALARLEGLRWWRERGGLVGRRRRTRLTLAKPYRPVPFQLRPVLKARLDTSGRRLVLAGRVRPGVAPLYPLAIPPLLTWLLLTVPSENRGAVAAALAVSAIVVAAVLRAELADYEDEAHELEALAVDLLDLR